MPERIATRLIEGGLVSSPIKMPCSIACLKEVVGLAQGFDIGGAQMLIPANTSTIVFWKLKGDRGIRTHESAEGLYWTRAISLCPPASSERNIERNIGRKSRLQPKDRNMLADKGPIQSVGG